MRRRYWISALLLLLFGCLYAFVFRAYRFSGWLAIGLAGLISLFGLLDGRKEKHPRGTKILRRILRAGLCLVLPAALITGIYVGLACSGAENPQADYVIVLGAGVNGTKPSQSLRERLEAARDYLEAYPQAVAVLSGGKGSRERITEAECMYRWLLDHGVSEERLRKEEQATTTEENIRYSLDLIQEETGLRPKTAAVVSSAYHLRRAELLGKQEGLEVLGWPASTRNPLFFANMFLREICGVWYILIMG